MSITLHVCLLVCLLAVVQSSIVKLPTKGEGLLQREREPIPLEKIQQELSLRAKRDSSDPMYSQILLNDTNIFGLVQYTGGNSTAVSTVIFVLTYGLNNGAVTNWNLYLSNDYGAHFTKINSRIEAGVTLDNNIYTSPEDPKKVYFADDTSAKIYLSEDEGATFTTRTFSPSTIDPRSLLPHPIVEDWVLARGTDSSLHVSRNLGKTAFTKIADNVFSSRDYQWGDKTYDLDDTIVYYNTDNPSQTTSEVDLYTQQYPYTNATKKEFDTSLGAHDGFLLLGRYIFVQKTIQSQITLWVSADRQPFKQTKIPTPYNHQAYLVTHINSLQTLVVIRHTASYYNLYMSEEQGELYYLALEDLNVVVTSGGGYIVDLELIDSMNRTTYIANQNFSPSSSSTSSLRTVISHDVGANWEPLKPPASVDTECVLPLCSLHLHMSTSEYRRTGVYSQASAPGIIIAHGATGQSLNDDNTNLFISRDGGSTWFKTLDGTWGVSVLDHGGVIVAAKDYHNDADASKTLSYTCDEGITWSSLTFTQQGIKVYGVISEPGETTTVVSLYGVQSNSWVVVKVDMDPIFSSTCVQTDYYNWMPFDDITETNCLLGASITIERRLPSHCCLNGRDYIRTVSYSVCTCSEEDFECDYGYKHANGFSGVCVRDEDVDLVDTCQDGDISFTQSLGYHKIGGDVCSGGTENNYQPYEAPCCANGNGTTTVTRTSPPVTSTSVTTVTTTSISMVTTTSTSILSMATVTVTTTIRAGSSTGDNSSNDGSSTLSIILGLVLGLALIVIGAFIVVTMVIIILKKKKSAQISGYSRVPIGYRPSSTSGGVHNINYVGDDDDEPLPL